MKLPRDISGEELARLLKEYGHQISRQSGSHMRLTSNLRGEHHITIPKHKPLKVGTLNGILSNIAEYLELGKQMLINELFSERK